MGIREKVMVRISNHLSENGIKHEIIGDIIHTELCTIEVSGYPHKPEYWVNEVRISLLENIADAVNENITA